MAAPVSPALHLLLRSAADLLLRMHRVVNPHHQPDETGTGPFPILILHGLFQSSGSFITSEERSLAFWLSERGYQVFLGNTRAVFQMGHKHFSRSDPRFWGKTTSCLRVSRFQ
jgi:lysosomal acid lipase/cholesteryl ester hydrolase